MAFVAAVLVAGLCCKVFAETSDYDWKPFAADKHFSYYYDGKKIVYPYKTIRDVLNLELAKVGIVRVRTKRIIKDEKSRVWQIEELEKRGLAPKGYDKYEYTLSSKELSCTDKKFKLLSETDYSKKGDILGSFVKEPASADWEPIPPSSETEALQLVICSKKKNKELEQPRPAL